MPATPHRILTSPRYTGLARVVAASRSRRVLLRAALAALVPLVTGGLAACGDAVGTIAAPFRRSRAPTGPTRAPLAAPLTYVALGASDAVGEGMPNGWHDGWVPSLAGRLPPPVKLVNLGIGGSMLRDALERQLPRAIEAQPDLVTVWLVVNDALSGISLDDYRRDLDSLLAGLRARTTATVAVGNAPYPPAHLDPWGIPDILRRTIVGSWNRAIAGSVRQHGALLVDLYASWKLAEHPEYIGPDGLHPTATGYRALTNTFHQALTDHHVV